ncbi:MAG TPA: ATP-binding cassette domain-containing protein [Mycobacteriales bacterium]|jgi:ABC-type branched-subunit amino acid transport system ATPase component|nr:ATP-binding cassette domain-containing protein [Mycobacteriales bacterium]
MGVVEVRELSVRAGGAAVRAVDLYLAGGEVVGLLGDAGGSALVRAIGGAVTPTAGVVRVDGEDVAGRPAHVVRAHGVVLVAGARAAFPALTVRENVAAGAGTAPGCGAGARVARAARTQRVLGWFPRLAAVADVPAGDLGPDEAAALPLAVAVARRPRLVLVDGLGPFAERAAYLAALAGLRAAGVDGITALVADPEREGQEAAPEEYDRAFLVRGEVLRPWFAAARLAAEEDDAAAG